MLWYVLLIAVVNLGIGFAAAVYAGRRYRAVCLAAIEDALGDDAVGIVAPTPAASDGGLESIDQTPPEDPVAEPANRAGLEACLLQWREQDPQSTRRLAAAMIDIDRFGPLSQRYGRSTCDRVLRGIARLITAENRDHLLVSRFLGQRFLLLLPDTDAAGSASTIERLRQTIELARFECQGEDIRVTVSCAVTEVRSDDTAETLSSRAEAALLEAKRYGGNRTFVYEGDYPAPVVPPSFSLEERRVPV